jgi:hypothetical protein
MLQQRWPVDRAIPWLVSGASGVYIVARTRYLSRAEASSDPLLRFLLNQADVLVMLCGSPAIWHAAMRQRKANAGGNLRAAGRTDAQHIHKLRQVLSALLLGIGLLERRITRGTYSEIGSLVKRLHAIVREGAQVLAALDTPSPEAALVPVAPTRPAFTTNGRHAKNL